MQYLGKSTKSVGTRFTQHRRSILNDEIGKTIPDYFRKIKSNEDDLRFVPFMKMKDNNPFGLITYEKHLINKYNLVACGINIIR